MVKHIERVRCVSANTGIVHLRESWCKKEPPPLFLGQEERALSCIEPLSQVEQAELLGYYLEHEHARFMVSIDALPAISPPMPRLYFAAPFNGWEKAIGDPVWEMHKDWVNDREYYVLNLAMTELAAHGEFSFKYVTENRQWLEVSEASPNRETIEGGRYNLRFDPSSQGSRLFRFKTPSRHTLAKRTSLIWNDGEHREIWPLFYQGELLNLCSDAPLGAHAEDGCTVFRVFAPRADAVNLELSQTPLHQDFQEYPLSKESDGTWTIKLQKNFSEHLYQYRVAGTNHDEGTSFNKKIPVLDPYAKASLGRDGPGIVIPSTRFLETTTPFVPPAMNDLVVVEAHLRDLLANSTLPLNQNERLGFEGLRKWASDKGNYLRSLGANAVELQPVQEFDNMVREEYHWGYMPVNYFSPASAYSSNPGNGSGIEEFRAVVEAFHQSGVAVLVDVVCNHMGLPTHLAMLDKSYYFDHDVSLEQRNWSGCGNDLRRDAPMVRRLLVDSLVHWVRAFDVDGFRFDLAELLEKPLLLEIEAALRQVKPSVLLIAEPWSFRGRIDDQLSKTTYSSWNDSFRDFMKSYVQGKGDSDGVIHYLKGTPGKSYFRPCQSINYLESHDDRCFIDSITENPNHDGRNPTPNDMRRARLAMACMLMAQGVPMLSAGQDFLRSKSGIQNTYQRGDLNVLDYDRLERFRILHDYCRAWIAFRLSDDGLLIRLTEYPRKSFWAEYRPVDCQSSAAGLLLNADSSMNGPKLLFAINPEKEEVKLPITAGSCENALLIADAERFELKGLRDDFLNLNRKQIVLPPLQLALWRMG